MTHRFMEKLGVIFGVVLIVYFLPHLLANVGHPSIAAKIILIVMTLTGAFIVVQSAYENSSVQVFATLFLACGLGLLIYDQSPFSDEVWGAASSGLGTEFLGIFATVWGIDRLNRVAEQKREKRLEQELAELSKRVAKLHEYIARRETL